MLVLASSSPRRAMLLKEWGYDFRILHSAIDEDLPPDMPPHEGVRLLAERKAKAGVSQWRARGGHPEDIVIAADTMVVLNGIILGKPRDSKEAAAMLARLSGRTHSVLTGVAICRLDGLGEAAVVETKVSFRRLSEAEIQSYVQSGDPMDKAGAYGIQGEAGKFVERIDGSLANVIGLPMEFLQQRLKAWGI